MTNVSKEHCLEIVSKFEPCPDNQTLGVLGIDGFTNYMRSPAGDIFNPEHYEVNQDMSQPLSNYFIASSHNTYLMGDQLMSQSRVDMYAWVLQAGCRCVEVDCWDGQDGEPIVHHGYTLTSKILFKDVIETINKYAFIKNQYPIILSIENHCSVPQQKKMAQYLTEVLGDKLDVSSIPNDPSGLLPSPEALKGKILIKGKKLSPNIDENAEEGDVSDEDSADEMEDDCKLMNGDTSMNRKQAENVAKKKLDNLMKESKIRDREDPDSFTIAALPPTGKHDKSPLKGKAEDSTDTGDEANVGGNKRLGRSFMGSFSKRKKKTSKVRKSSSFEDTDTDQESSSGASKAPVHHSRKKKTMKLSRALSDLVYTKSVGIPDFEAQVGSSGWQVSSMSETKAHQLMQQKPVQFMRFNQRQLSRIYPSPYRVDSSNFNPQPFWNAGCHLVALNYQTEGRVLQLNRAKFYCNGNCGYILKPACMCEGSLNPVAEDPLPGRLKKQLVLKIISGQQLPKPKDSMLGDRGEIIDPFVEVEIIGLPVDCCKEQTRVVDDNGFNPMWEETLVFTLHMPEIALIRFLVWDHDPIGQDFIGQRTIAFNSMIPGYRHVYLEGMEEASIFVHVAVNDITSKVRAVSGIKGLFHRNPKQASLDSHAAALLNRKSTFGAHLLRRTASAPTKGQPKVKRGFPEISIDTKDCSSEGASEERESEEGPPVHHNGDTASAKSWGHGTNGQLHPDDSKGKSTFFNPEPRATPSRNRGAMSEPLKRANKLRLQDPLDEKPGVFARVAINSSGRVGMTSNCIKCVIGSKESPVLERKDTRTFTQRTPAPLRPERVSRSPTLSRQVQPEPILKPQGLAQTDSKPKPDSPGLPKPVPLPRSRAKVRQTLAARPLNPTEDPIVRNDRSCSVPRQLFQFPSTPPPPIPDSKTSLCRQCRAPPNYGSSCNDTRSVSDVKRLSDSDSSSCDSLASLDLPTIFPSGGMENRKRAAGTLQREMNALFAQKMEEIRSKSPLFFDENSEVQNPTPSLNASCLGFITEEFQENSPLTSTQTPVDTSPHCPSTTLSSPSTAITTSSNGENLSPVKNNEDILKSFALTQCIGPYSTTGKNSVNSHINSSLSTNYLDIGCDTPPLPDQENGEVVQKAVTDPNMAEIRTGLTLETDTAKETTAIQSSQRIQALKGVFDRDIGRSMQTGLRTPVRRTKSEAQMKAVIKAEGPSVVPEVSIDATLNDRLWSKLDPGSHRDSVSSSSSISSNDTVIDLSLPNLSRKSLTCLSSARDYSDNQVSLASRTSHPRSTVSACNISLVSKSKSNPNLRDGEMCDPEDDLQPRPLVAEKDPVRPMQRRHTWSRLYMEGLKQSSILAASTSPRRSTTPSAKDMDSSSKSKSLGDLTSDDIACNFESKYRSISRSFIVRPSRQQGKAFRKPQNDLTEQLKRLTDVEPLTSKDFAQYRNDSETGQEEEEMPPLRRSSSRSQSRVRYIANRARQAQERQRLQSLTRTPGSPIEERGNPEGACSVPHSPCASLDLLSQLPPGPPQQSSLSPDNEVFFMLKL
ncbi:1-phosphatidylinositol 4,5-bisphosphate phosphodiesterase eta-2 [Labeo rohita]|uniref:Phosphoinositide phospholipase C n=1 Tax=Labeo rohita TaxID=84645 RepID=A0ABQ8MG32_LABRO|nr:1-phosphatidylinositol 4,5-bisphosphate phosphodiesterase eta-2 [Labeo rohita]